MRLDYGIICYEFLISRDFAPRVPPEYEEGSPTNPGLARDRPDALGKSDKALSKDVCNRLRKLPTAGIQRAR